MNKESKLPLVSVITPAFNRIPLLVEALNSVKRQTYRPIELIVVDDGSGQPVKEAVEGFATDCDFEVRYIRQKNSGPGVARRTALQCAKGEFVQYLDSDDIILPDKIQLQVEMMLKDPQAVMCYTITLHVGKDGKRRKRNFSDIPAEELLSTALQYRRWHTSSCLWHYPDKKIANWVNLYNGEDLIHDLSVGIHYNKIIFLPQILTIASTGEAEHISETPLELQALRRINENRYNSQVLVFDILKKHRLLNYPRYSKPLALRFFHTGLILAIRDDLKRSIAAFRHIPKIWPGVSSILLSETAILMVRLTRGKGRRLYQGLFRLHHFFLKRMIVGS